MGKNKKKFIILVCTLFFFLISTIIVGGILISRPSIQKRILKKVSERLGFTVQMEGMRMSLSHGIGINIMGASFKSPDGAILISCKRLFVYYRISQLIKGRFIPQSVIIQGPDMIFDTKKLSPNKKAAQFSPKKIFLAAASFPSLEIRDGKIAVIDHGLNIDGLELKVQKKAPKVIHISFYSRSKVNGCEFPIHASGIIYVTNKGMIKAELDAGVKGFPLTCIYKKDLISFASGKADTRLRLLVLSNGRIKASGGIVLKNINSVLVGSDNLKKRYRFDQLNWDFSADYSKKIINIPHLKIQGKDFRLDVDSKIDLNPASPHIYVNVNSKSMPISAFKKIFPSCLVADWLEDRLFPIIKEGMVRDVRFSIDGSAEQINHIDSPKNRDVIRGSLIMDNLLLWPKGAKNPLKDIKGLVGLKNGTFFIKDIRGDIASSHVKDAQISIKDVYQDNPSFFVHVNGLFDLKELMDQRDMEFTPPSVIKAMDGIKEVSGKIMANVKYEYRSSWKRASFNNSSVRFINCHIIHRDLNLPVSINKGQFWIDSSGKYHLNAIGMLGKSSLSLLVSSDPSMSKLKLTASGTAYLSELFEPYIKGKIAINGPTKLAINLNKIRDLYDIRGTIYITRKMSLRVSPLSLNPKRSSINFALRYSPDGGLELKRAHFRSRGSSFYISGSYNRAHNRLMLRFKTSKLELRDLGIRYQDLFEASEGEIAAQLKIDLPLNNLSLISIYGPFKANGIVIRKKGVTLIDRGSSQLCFSGKMISITSLNANVGKYPIHLKGNIKGWKGIKGKLDAKIDYIDLRKLRLGTGSKKAGMADFLKNTDLDFSLTILKGICKKIAFRPIKARIKIIKGNLYIEDLQAQLPSGQVRIRGHLAKDKRPAIWLDSEIRLKGMSLKDIFSCIGVKRYIDGSMNMRSHIYVKAMNFDQIISHLNGNARISVKEGKIYKAQPVLKILDFFSISNIWKFNPTSFFENGVPFQLIEIKAGIKDGIIKSDKMFMESKALNAAGKGTLDLKKKRIDLGIGIQPLNTVQSIIGKLPIVGYILTGKDKKLTLYYFEIKGPLKDVKIEQRPFKNLLNGTFGIFKRILLTPSHVFEDMGG